MKYRFSFMLAALLLFCFAYSAPAEKWSRAYIRGLPDSAFAAVEFTKEGSKIRYLPHHNHNGAVDIGHVKSALGRLHQVKWLDAVNSEKAREHLEQHLREYKTHQPKEHED